MAGTKWYLLWCRECDPELDTPMPFPSAEDRGRWAAAHTRGTGHARWLVIDKARPTRATGETTTV